MEVEASAWQIADASLSMFACRLEGMELKGANGSLQLHKFLSGEEGDVATQ